MPAAWCRKRCSGRRCAGAWIGSERGSAVTDFVLVGALLTVIFVAVLQLALVLHVRNTLADAASSGARYGTLADRQNLDAEDRTVSLISMALGEEYAQDVIVDEIDRLGMATIRVTVIAPLPIMGLIGPAGGMEVRGHAAK